MLGLRAPEAVRRRRDEAFVDSVGAQAAEVLEAAKQGDAWAFGVLLAVLALHQHGQRETALQHASLLYLGDHTFQPKGSKDEAELSEAAPAPRPSVLLARGDDAAGARLSCARAAGPHPDAPRL